MVNCAKKICEPSKTEIKKQKVCHLCGSQSKQVSLITVRYMLKGIFQSEVHEGSAYRFCPVPTCTTVYFSENNRQTFTKDQLSERVTIKEKEDPIPICYCFNFFRHDVEKEIKETGKTIIPDFISKQVKDKNCFCEYTNPQGTCCLGHVGSIVKSILKKEVLS